MNDAMTARLLGVVGDRIGVRIRSAVITLHEERPPRLVVELSSGERADGAVNEMVLDMLSAAILRPQVVRCEWGSVDSGTGQCFDRAGVPIRMPPRERELMAVLASSAGQFVPRQEIARKIWGSAVDESGNIRTLLSKLRKRIGDTTPGGKYIVSQVGGLLLTVLND